MCVGGGTENKKSKAPSVRPEFKSACQEQNPLHRSKRNKNVFFFIFMSFKSHLNQQLQKQTLQHRKKKDNAKKTGEVIKKKAAIILLSYSHTTNIYLLSFCGFYNMNHKN